MWTITYTLNGEPMESDGLDADTVRDTFDHLVSLKHLGNCIGIITLSYPFGKFGFSGLRSMGAMLDSMGF